MNAVFSSIFAIIGLLGSSAALAGPNWLLERLAVLQTDPAVIEAVGAQGYVREVVKYPEGVFVYYQGAGREICRGTLAIMFSGKLEFFADPNCQAPPKREFAPQGQGHLPAAVSSQALNQLAEFSKAVAFAERIPPRAKGYALRELVGVQRADGRILVTYSTTGTSDYCVFAMRPVIMGHPSLTWQYVGEPACNAQ